MAKDKQKWRWDDLPIHPANTQRPMSDEALKRLAKDIKARGLEHPLIIFRDNTAEKDGRKDEPNQEYRLDGVNRAKAIKLLGIADPADAPLSRGISAFVVVNRWTSHHTMSLTKGGMRKGWTEVDPYALHKSLNVHRRHLTPAQQGEEIDRVAKTDPHKSNRAIAREVGVHHETVAKRLAKGAANGDNRQKPQPAERAAKALADNPQASNREIAKAAKTDEATVRRARKATTKPKKPAKEKLAKPTKTERQAQKVSEQEQADKELVDWFVDVAKRESVRIATLITWLEEANMKRVIKLLREVKS